MSAPATQARPLLAVEDLRVTFHTESGPVHAVDGVTFSVDAGRTLGIVGESGCGKSVTSLAAMGLVHGPTTHVSGAIRFAGQELLTAPEERRRALRGGEMAMVFQDPLTSLHPLHRVGWQIAEAIRAHRGIGAAAARAHAVELLGFVGIPSPDRQVDSYPHELSGGMRQRAMIAMALANEPRLLIADEPTTALDVTVQAQILALMTRLQDELGMAIVFISHDLGVVAQMAHDVAVMYAGQIVEQAPTERLFRAPGHPYTWGLLGSIPRLTGPRGTALAAIPGRPPDPGSQPTGCRFHPRCPYAREEHRTIEPPLAPVGDLPGHRAACLLPEATRRRLWADLAVPGDAVVDQPPVATRAAAGPLLEVRGVVKHFPIGHGGLLRRSAGAVHAVDDVSFDVGHGETLGIVGESGCGKSTLARLMTGLLAPTQGEVRFDGAPVHGRRGAAAARLRRDVQMIFQDPYASLNDRRPAGAIIAEPLAIHGLAPGRAERRRRVAELMEAVGLNPAHADRHPHEFSGGQRQRIGIARALALEPRLIVADEPVAALDASIQAQILNLLHDLQRRLDLTLVFIAHDLAVVRHMCDRIVVMYLGQAVEIAAADQLYARPAHPYTEALMSAVPLPEPRRKAAWALLPGDPPSPSRPPAACRFHTRCSSARDVCRTAVPPLRDTVAGALAACHFPRHLGDQDAVDR